MPAMDGAAQESVEGLKRQFGELKEPRIAASLTTPDLDLVKRGCSRDHLRRCYQLPRRDFPKEFSHLTP
jgi:hypothetical protein